MSTNVFSKLLGYFIFIFCITAVVIQVYIGTKRFLYKPVASTISSKEVEFPAISVCHIENRKNLMMDRTILNHDQFSNGAFLKYNNTAEKLMEEAADKFFYLLDHTGVY